jgi:glycosyltransferase involved in cell wall biosynthesis
MAELREPPMHIAVLGPIASADVRHLLHEPSAALPGGYAGAPLMATLIEGLLARGHRVTAITLSADMPLDGSRAVGAEGPRFTLVCCPLRPRAWPFNGWRPGRIVDLFAYERAALLRAINAAAPDVVHAHWAYEFGWAALDSGLPHVITSHDAPLVIARYYGGLVLGGYRWLRALMARHVLRRARLVTTVSPYMVREIQPWCRQTVNVVPNPVAASVFELRREPVPGRQRVLMVCNGWSARKNPEPALRAFALLSRRLPDAELVLLGTDFAPGQRASQWWAQMGLIGNVRFVGSVPYASVLGWMADSDVLLHPALEESFGAVIAEAMALGVPAIAGQASGAVPWVVGDDGLLVDVHQPQAMCDALVRLLQDVTLRQALGNRGRASMAARFGAESVVMQYEALCRRAVAAAPQSARLAAASEVNGR